MGMAAAHCTLAVSLQMFLAFLFSPAGPTELAKVLLCLWCTMVPTASDDCIPSAEKGHVFL